MWLVVWLRGIWAALIDDAAENETDLLVDDEEVEDEDDSDEEDIGKKPDRSKFIPRSRFDKVNAKAQQIDKLVKAGKAKINEDGELELIVEEKTPPQKEEKREDTKVNFNELLVKETDVDKNSWPLVDKLQKQVGYFIPLMNQMYDLIDVLAEQQAIVREFAEHGALKKDSDFNKLMKEIEENDDEFKTLFKGKRGQKYYAAKRAFSKLQDSMKSKTGDKPDNKSSKFIIGKGEAPPTGKTVLSEDKVMELSKTEAGRRKLDEYEKNLWSKKGGN